ncbi:MAG: hypothetical protein DIU61_007245 [Bacteroidota bacterium]|jgi:hypothetical protein|nr:MAG: hypothetical protein DIU61_08620 [Bacteroidota bacterium]
MERQKFEESFRKSFDNAEVQPSEKVWMNIELDLERLERGHMKKRLTFFKFLAAASVVFGLGLAGTGLYLLSVNRTTPADLTAQQKDTAPIRSEGESGEQPLSSEPSVIADSESSSIASAETPTESSSRSSDERSSVSERSSSSDQPSQSSASSSTPRQSLASASDPQHANATDSRDVVTTIDRAAVQEATSQRLAYADGAVAVNDRQVGQSAIPAFRDRPLPPLVKQKTIVPHFPKTEPDQVDLLLASIAMEERAERERKKYDDERIWTSVGFSAGTFSNNSTGTVQPPMLFAGTSNMTAANNTLASESRASGVAYSVGVNVGGRIASRWVLQGGINYITQNASFTSDAVLTDDFLNFSPVYSAEITKAADASARVVPTAPYGVNNSMEFLSIPIQAGYLVVNRAFGIQVMGGVATDLFIQNTLEPQSGNLAKVTNGNGSDSPYRTINFSGLVGTEFSYRFADKYRISLNPGLRYPFNSMYKSDVGISATPVTFDVGLRFRYIFN